MSSKIILLVEDNRDDEMLTIRAFKKSSIANEIVVARDGVEALDYLFRRGKQAERQPDEMPQVVLLDLNLPRVGGLDVLQQLRADARTKLLPVVVLTSSREEEDIVRSYSFGANAFVRKPVEFSLFLDAVRTLGLFWVLLNEPAPASPPQAR